MRSLFILAAVMIAIPADAQRVFRASSLDVEQNDRIEKLEAKTDRIEQSIAKIANALEAKAPAAEQSAAGPTPHRPSVSEPPPVAGSSPPDRQVLSDDYMSTADLQTLIWQLRPGGWNGPIYADVEPRSQAKRHLIGSEHRFRWDQVAGLSQTEALILHDFAPGHGDKIFPTRSEQNAAYQRDKAKQRKSQVVQRPAVSPIQPQQQMGCANGQCATSGTSPVSGGFIPFQRLRIFR